MYVFWSCWSRRFKAETIHDRERSIDRACDQERSLASTRPVGHMLVLFLGGSAKRLLEHASERQRCEGLLSWLRLEAEYEPATVGRTSRTMCGDRVVRRCESAHGEIQSDCVKIAVIQEGIGKEHLVIGIGTISHACHSSLSSTAHWHAFLSHFRSTILSSDVGSVFSEQRAWRRAWEDRRQRMVQGERERHCDMQSLWQMGT